MKDKFIDIQASLANSELSYQLLSKIDFGSKGESSSCWLWKSTLDSYGYGVVSINKKQYKAHRVVYESIIGEIPNGLFLDHLCRITNCVNPDHLEPVTHEENQKRGIKGELTTRCKKGHPYNEQNTRIHTTPTGGKWRQCRTCQGWTGLNE